MIILIYVSLVFQICDLCYEVRCAMVLVLSHDHEVSSAVY